MADCRACRVGALSARRYSHRLRGRLGGAVAGVVATTLLLWPLKPKGRPSEAVVVGLLVACIGAFAVASLGQQGVDSNVAARIQAVGDLSNRNTVARVETWRAASESIAERPVVGWGPDSFQLAFESNRTQAFSRIVDPTISQLSAHNWILQTAVETGVVGLVALVAFYSAVAVISARWIRRGPPDQLRLRITMLAGAWAGCAGFLVTSLLTPGSPPARYLLWCLMALLLSPSAADRLGSRALGSGCLPRRCSGLACLGSCSRWW